MPPGAERGKSEIWQQEERKAGSPVLEIQVFSRVGEGGEERGVGFLGFFF